MQDDKERDLENENSDVPKSAPEYNFWADQIAEEVTSYEDGMDEKNEMANIVIEADAIGTEYDAKIVNPEMVFTKDKKKKNNKLLKLVASAIIFGLVVWTVFRGADYITDQFTENDQPTIAQTKPSSEITTTKATVVDQGTSQVSDVSTVVENVMPSIVSITSSVKSEGYSIFGQAYDDTAESSGSGIIVGENDTELLVVTNNHVVEGATKIQVTFNDTKVVDGVIKGTDSTADLAVVAVKISDISEETKSSIKIASLGDSEGVKVGQMAIAIGNALGYGQSVTVGYISAKDREVTVGSSNNVQEGTKMTLLQTDAAINPGNSGGALLNVNGEVVGINSVKYASAEVEGMGYAIPISRALPIINDLMNREILEEDEKGYLGISGTDVTSDANSVYDMPLGVYVFEVADGGAAKEAGILKGDIITAINDMQVTSISALKEKANSFRSGTEVELSVQRSSSGAYEEIKLKVKLKDMSTLNDLKDSSESKEPSENK